jgi:hypothetical protein
MPTPFQEYAEIVVIWQHLPQFRAAFKDTVRIADYECFDGSCCWLWNCVTPEIVVDLDVRRRTFLAHRVAYALYYGRFESSWVIRHLCGNNSTRQFSRFCVNPLHLKAYPNKAALLADYNHRRTEFLLHRKEQDKERWSRWSRCRDAEKLLNSLTNPQPAKEATA